MRSDAILSGLTGKGEMTLKCKSCKRDLPEQAIFCCWCGEKQLRERKKKNEIKVPKPRLLPSGNWFIQLKAEGQSITEATPELCIAKATAIRAGFMETRAKPDNICVAEAITKYIEQNKNTLKDRTIEQYEYIRDKRFASLMKTKLVGITTEKIELAKNEELGKPSPRGGKLSPKTVNDALHLVLTVVNKYSNGAPKVEVKAAEVQRQFKTILPPEEIYPAIKGTDIELPCLLAMWLSLSVSEIRGLTKSKSLRNGKLYIVETVVDVKGTVVRKAGAKEEERPRVLDIPPYIQDLISNVEGDIIEPRTSRAINARFHKCLERASLPPMSFHGLRHVNASVMADLDIPTPVAQERGGWKTDRTMKQTYTHAFTASRREADKKIDARFEQIINGCFANGFANENVKC